MGSDFSRRLLLGHHLQETMVMMQAHPAPEVLEVNAGVEALQILR